MMLLQHVIVIFLLEIFPTITLYFVFAVVFFTVRAVVSGKPRCTHVYSPLGMSDYFYESFPQDFQACFTREMFPNNIVVLPDYI